MKKLKNVIITIIGTLLVFAIPIETYIYKHTRPDKISYNDFLVRLYNNEIDRVVYDESNLMMKVYYFNDNTRDLSYEDRCEYKEYNKTDSNLVSYPDSDGFIEKLLRHDIVVKKGKIGVYVSFALYSLLYFGTLILLLFALIGYFVSKTGNTDTYVDTIKVTTRFDDVIGQDEVIEELKFITNFIKSRNSKQCRISIDNPKGVMFIGPPGTGKTLMARAIAGEANVPFYYLNASSCIEMFVGLGAKRIRDIFKTAKKNSPSVLFIDEIDAIGLARGKTQDTMEHRQTLNALLQELDGFDNDTSVFVIAATNDADNLDPALVRAGRFDRQITINPPVSWEVRLKMFKHYFEHKPLADDVNLEVVAKMTAGCTGADIAQIVNWAGIVAISKGNDFICQDNIDEAVDEIVLKGNRRSHNKDSHLFDIVCYHEAGHAVMQYLLGIGISRISVIGSTSGVGGATFESDEEMSLKTREDLRNKIKVLYAGLLSEEIKFNKDNATVGASNDLQNASELVNNYFQFLRRKDSLIDWTYIRGVNIDESLVKEIDSLSIELRKEAEQLLRENFDLVEKLVDALKDSEILSGEQIKVLLKRE